MYDTPGGTPTPNVTIPPALLAQVPEPVQEAHRTYREAAAALASARDARAQIDDDEAEYKASVRAAAMKGAKAPTLVADETWTGRKLKADEDIRGARRAAREAAVGVELAIQAHGADVRQVVADHLLKAHDEAKAAAETVRVALADLRATTDLLQHVDVIRVHGSLDGPTYAVRYTTAARDVLGAYGEALRDPNWTVNRHKASPEESQKIIGDYLASFKSAAVADLESLRATAAEVAKAKARAEAGRK